MRGAGEAAFLVAAMALECGVWVAEGLKALPVADGADGVGDEPDGRERVPVGVADPRGADLAHVRMGVLRERAVMGDLHVGCRAALRSTDRSGDPHTFLARRWNAKS